MAPEQSFQPNSAWCSDIPRPYQHRVQVRGALQFSNPSRPNRRSRRWLWPVVGGRYGTRSRQPRSNRSSIQLRPGHRKHQALDLRRPWRRELPVQFPRDVQSSLRDCKPEASCGSGSAVCGLEQESTQAQRGRPRYHGCKPAELEQGKTNYRSGIFRWSGRLRRNHHWRNAAPPGLGVSPTAFPHRSHVGHRPRTGPDAVLQRLGCSDLPGH